MPGQKQVCLLVGARTKPDAFAICLAICRVTISGKAKIGTMDGHFAPDQIYGLFKFFFNKIGTLKFSSRRDLGGRARASKRKKKGLSPKKKKRFVTFFRPKTAQNVQPNRC